MMDGTTNEKDAKLLAAIEAADPFDGGCPADVEHPEPLNHKEDFSDYLRDKMHRQRRYGIREGMERAAQLCLDAGYVVAADKIIMARE